MAFSLRYLLSVLPYLYAPYYGGLQLCFACSAHVCHSDGASQLRGFHGRLCIALFIIFNEKKIGEPRCYRSRSRSRYSNSKPKDRKSSRCSHCCQRTATSSNQPCAPHGGALLCCFFILSCFFAAINGSTWYGCAACGGVELVLRYSSNFEPSTSTGRPEKARRAPMPPDVFPKPPSEAEAERPQSEP